MTVDIKAVYEELTGTAPDRQSVDKIMRAGRVMRLLDHDAFWLVMVAWESQQAEVARSMRAATNLTEVTQEAAAKTNAAAETIRKVLKEGGPWLSKKIQEAALGVSGELTGAIGDAAGRGANTIVTATEKVAAAARSELASSFETAGRQAADRISAASKSAISALDRAKMELDNEAALAGRVTVAKWANAVDEAVQKLLTQKSENDRASQRRRTLLTIAMTVLVTLGGFTGVWMTANDAGYRTGYAEGLQSNFDAKERAAWANTKEGREAYLLGLTVSIQTLATCGNPGWKVEKQGANRVCFPHEAVDGLHGWAIP
jgi:hypothetical protein